MRVAEAEAAGIAPKRGGLLQSVITPEPPILILGVNQQAPTLEVGSKIYQGLLEFSETLEPKPLLAKSWEISADKTRYTFHLQPGVLWHDGEKFTADDVIFSIMQFNMTLAPRARAVFASIKSATAPDPMTVVLTLAQPFEPFLLMFDVTATPMMPKHIYDGTDYRTNPHNQTPIGTGPFQLDHWQRGSFIRLKRFEKYWKPGQPYLDGIVYRVIPDSQSRALALQTGQIALTSGNDIEPFDIPRFRAMPTLAIETKGWEMFSPLAWLELNNRVKPLDDVRVRQAISHAIDRKFIAERLWFGTAKPATSPIASTTRYHDPAAHLQDYDPKKAMALLDEAGLKPGAGGVRFTLRHLELPYGEVWTRLSEYIRAALGKIGIALTMESTDPGGWASRMSNWNYDTTINYLYQFGDPTLGVERSYVSSNIKKVVFTNTEGYSNPEVDALFAKARVAPDTASRRKDFYAVQKLLIEQVPVVWLIELTFPTIHKKTLHDVITLGTGVQGCFDDVFLA
ncbi:MAG: ABC transporter substrate-binding protein [Rhodospirillales bacterium]|nr:ABC transporter substrate-binding protein [Rhodospirillales bacterium]